MLSINVLNVFLQQGNNILFLWREQMELEGNIRKHVAKFYLNAYWVKKNYCMVYILRNVTITKT